MNNEGTFQSGAEEWIGVFYKEGLVNSRGGFLKHLEHEQMLVARVVRN